MGGVYFVAAGESSQNRKKSLDRGHPLDSLRKYIGPQCARELERFFPNNELIYLWGANKEKDLGELSPGDYVVDVKNKAVMQVFSFCFHMKVEDERLQEHIGWDSNKPKEGKRLYHHIYFLKDPLPTKRKEKGYFQRAFEQDDNQNWLVGQRWFDNARIRRGMNLTHTSSVEMFLGIEASANQNMRTQKPSFLSKEPSLPHQNNMPDPLLLQRALYNAVEKADEEPVDIPFWLTDSVAQITILKQDSEHQERDHEDVVAGLFSALGFVRGQEIKFQSSHIDILIYGGKTPLITVEVKKDWALSAKSKDYLKQAYNYSHEQGTRYVIITNGDCYILYDHTKGLGFDEQYVGEFKLTHLTEPGKEILLSLRKSQISNPNQ
jgi:hypothetical protein